MPSQSSLFDYPMYSFPRYTQGTFPSAPVQPANPLLTPAAGDSSFAARQSWPLDSNSTEYDSPNSTPYSEYGSPFEQEQYSSSVASQSVAYPESSQRTHVAGSAFTSLYTPRFYPSSNSSNITPSRSSHSPEDEPAAYRFPASPQHGASSHADSTARAHHDAWQDFPDSTASFDRLPSQSIPSYARNAMMPPLQSHSTALNNRAFLSTLPSPDQSGFSRLLTRESPRDAAFSFQSRPQGGDAFGEPGNPSAVPPLVYDGEEYDDESECSLPSAGPDIHRSGYPVSQSSGDDSASSTAATYGGMDDRSSSPSDSAGSSPRSAVEQQPTNTERTKSGTQKKSKMHQCTVCSKWFPRPSGLATHMNSHSGAKPYKCPIASCTKSFAVRSNAKRHLRTHGIFPSSDHAAAPAQFTVGFDAPIISDVHEVSKLPAKLRWVPQSLATRTNVDFLRDAPSDSEDEYPPSCPVLSVPLPAVVPSSPKWNDEDYEDRNSYEDMGPSPYLSAHQWRALPGPAIVNPPSL